MLPTIDQPAEPNYSICRIEDIKGKTVDRVEYGSRAEIEGVHQSEAIILYFTDGSILGIQTGSNAGNLAADHAGLRAEDFNSSFHLQWVPPTQE